MSKSEKILDSMACQAGEALIAAGLDPKHPPTNMGKPPAEKAWGEYLRSGGDPKLFASPDAFMSALVKRIGQLS